MKSRRYILTLCALVLVPALSHADSSHGGHAHGAKESSHAASGTHNMSREQLAATLNKTFAATENAVNNKGYKDLHELTEELSDVASHLAEQAPEAARARLTGSAKNISTAASALHEAADKGDDAQVQNSFTKLKGMVSLFKAQIAE